MGAIRYAQTYNAFAPTAVSSARSDPHPFSRGVRGPDFERVNAAQESSLALLERCAHLWGSHLYYDATALVLEEDGLVGLLKVQPRTGVQVVTETVDAFLSAHGLDQLVIHADETGYVALLSHEKTTLHIRYFAGDDSTIIHRYAVCKITPAQYRRSQLQKEAPKPNKNGWRDGTLTEDIGVRLYDHVPLLSPNDVKVYVRADRKKSCTYSPGKCLQNTSISAVAAYLRTELPYSFSASFPSAAERELLRQGEPVGFTIRFKGYKAVGAEDISRDQILKKAYEDGVRAGIHNIFHNVYAALSAFQQSSVSQEVQLLRPA